jgi:3',5'-cyclic AMP phosphodiesterase CpdA
MYRILHLSDLHARASSEWSTIPILKEAKKRILTQASILNIDLVVFTGDIAFSGKKEEYAIAQAWLDDLCLNPSGLNIQKGQILLVPGNHDVDRGLITPTARAIEDALARAETEAAVARFYDDAESRQVLLKRNAAYLEFCASFLSGPSSSNHCWSKIFKAGTGRIRIDGLNTSWLCRGDDDHRRLLVGQSQLTEVIKSHADAELRITLMHHPLADLMDFDESNTSDFLKQNTDIVLRGHLHKAEATRLITNTGTFLELAAGSLHESHESPNRFSILDISDDLSELRVSTFLWQSGRWILDRNVYETSDGIGFFPLKKN